MINSIINFATTTVSLIVFCIMGVYGAVDAVQYNDIVAFEGDVMWGVSIGGFIAGNENLFKHEYGHELQRREYESAYLVMVAIPSVVSVMLNPNKHRNQWFEIDATKRGMDLQ